MSERPTVRDLYDVALKVTDEVMGEGTYARMNAGNPDPGVQAAIARYVGNDTPLAEKLRERLREYDDTLATPGQAQDIAEVDLLNDVRAMVRQPGET